MSPATRTTRHRILLGIITAAVALVLAGGAWAMFGAPITADPEPQPSPTTAAASSGAPAPASSSPTTAAASTPEADTKEERIALEAARIMTTWDTTKDANDSDAEARAKHLMTKKCADKVLTGDWDTTNKVWWQAAKHEGRSVPEVELTPHGDKGRVRVMATWHWTNDDGETLDDPTRRAFVFTFTDDRKPRISDYTWRDLN
ncbi:hypothetical protein HDA30_000237 [Micrococcus cohnii]|uniref:Uncharacterized protein n=1 Tax=Micrococcus cohnii TaxID=993416 RepID=A0A7W7GM96_9MICC|nr:hypothetical protein [Micrococcus cohnii]MBB4734729.1 hypothetical protein [Micrococcus cohnii]